MSSMISRIDITLVIPPKMRGFPNEDELTIEMKAEKPVEVPDFVLKHYTKSRPHVFREGSKPKPVEAPPPPPQEEEEFNPEEWLETNFQNIEATIEQLDRKELLAVGKYMRLDNVHRQKTVRVQERIIHDVKAKLSQEDEIDKHKGVSS